MFPVTVLIILNYFYNYIFSFVTLEMNFYYHWTFDQKLLLLSCVYANYLVRDFAIAKNIVKIFML